jgi:type VI secretion system protein VasG
MKCRPPKPIILFIDEAHTLIGAGGAAGTGDAASLHKPALARGTLRTIAATTWAEQSTSRGSGADASLPGREGGKADQGKTILMVRGVASVVEKRHRCRCSTRRSKPRFACRIAMSRDCRTRQSTSAPPARVAISQLCVPAELEDCRRTIEGLQTELEIIGREEAVGIDADGRRQAAQEKLTSNEQRRTLLEERWNAERELVDRVLAIRAKLRQGSEPVEGTGSKLEQAAQAAQAATTTQTAQVKTSAPVAPVSVDVPALQQVTAEERQILLGELRDLQTRLSALQGESPLILPSVDELAVGSVVQD